MNNAVFGKTTENIWKHVNIKLANNKNNKPKELAAKPNFERCTIFDENLIAIHIPYEKDLSMTNLFT